MPSIFRRRRRFPVRYYVYISQTKLEILFPQIPARFLPSLEAEISVNVGVLAASVRKSVPDPSPELAAKAGVLSDYLDKQSGWVGTVADPGRFVKGVALLQYGVMQDYAAELVFFGGVVDGVKLALIGSPASLIGAAADATANHSLNYYDLKFLRENAESTQEDSETQRYEYEQAIDDALEVDVLPPTRHKLEFLAKVIFHNENVLVATPIYVALAD